MVEEFKKLLEQGGHEGSPAGLEFRDHEGPPSGPPYTGSAPAGKGAERESGSAPASTDTEAQRREQERQAENHTKAMSLMSAFHAAIASKDYEGAKAILNQLMALDNAAVAGVGGNIDDDKVAVERASWHEEVVHNLAQEVVTTTVATAVGHDLTDPYSKLSKDFFNSFDPHKKYDLAELEMKNGHLHTKGITQASGQELKDAYANIEFGRLSTDQQNSILGQIKNATGVSDVGELEHERLSAIGASLKKMEGFTAMKIMMDEHLSPEEKMRQLSANHQKFLTAEAQVNSIISQPVESEHKTPDSDRIAKVALSGTLSDIRNTILLKDPSSTMALDANRDTKELLAQLPKTLADKSSGISLA